MEEKTNYLVHHGVKGMKWGVRRYQNADGSLTAAGRKQYGIKSKRPSKDTIKKAAKIAGAAGAIGGAAAGLNKASKSEAFDRTIKQGKDKPNISPAGYVTKNVNNAVKETGNIYRTVKKATTETQREIERAKRYEKVKKMSTEELRQKINRLNLEKQYMDLTDPYKNEGKDKVETILDVAQGIGGLTLAAVGVAEGVKVLKGLAKHS